MFFTHSVQYVYYRAKLRVAQYCQSKLYVCPSVCLFARKMPGILHYVCIKFFSEIFFFFEGRGLGATPCAPLPPSPTAIARPPHQLNPAPCWGLQSRGVTRPPFKRRQTFLLPSLIFFPLLLPLLSFPIIPLPYSSLPSPLPFPFPLPSLDPLPFPQK